MNQQVYKIIISEKDPYKSECLSCINENEKCTFASTIFSKKSSYSVQTCAGPGIPTVNVINNVCKLKHFSFYNIIKFS